MHESINAQSPLLLPGETLISMQYVVDPVLTRLPSSLKEIERLTNSRTLRDIGKNGPSMASLGLEGLDDDSPEKHLYEALFGRDSMRVAEDLLDKYPALARSTLIEMAKSQGVGVNPFREEELGKIIHELRNEHDDPIAERLLREKGWQWPYYGSVDSTVQFVRLFSAYCNKSSEGFDLMDQEYQGRDGQTHKMIDAYEMAVNWIERKLEQARGLLEYKASFIGSLENQGWKDSWDACFHSNGEIANHEQGIALIEVQAMVHDALNDASDIYKRIMGDDERSTELEVKARQLKRTVLDKFWVPERGGFFALGTDRDPQGSLRPMRVKTSNMGHLLKSGILAGDEDEVREKREAVIEQLFAPHMLGLNGIRTLSTEEVRYRPTAYHNGSVWIWDNYKIAQGLSGLGYHRLANVIYNKLLDDVNATRRFPEYLRGDDDPNLRLNSRIVDVFDNTYERENRIEQPPQDIQAWSVAAILAIKLNKVRLDKLAKDSAVSDFEQRTLEQLV